MHRNAISDRLERGFRLGRWRIEPCTGRIWSRGRPGGLNRVEPRAMQVLLALARRAGEFVGRDELLGEVWSGRVVTDDCLTRAIHDLRQAFGDDPRSPRLIETRTHVGYRLLLSPLTRQDAVIRWAAGAAAGVGLMALAGFLLWQRLPVAAAPGPAARTVAVLPFAPLSDSPEQAYLAAAITEALVTGLAQQPGLQVVSRTSVLAARAVTDDVAALARSLGAELLVDGSVQATTEQVRVSAQLIDPGRDDHLWAGQFDRRLDDVLALQDEVSGAITRQIGGIVAPGREAPALPALSMADYLHYRYLLAQESFDSVEQALEGFDRLLAQYPDFPPAHLGRAQALLYLFKALQRDPSALEEAHRALERFETLSHPTAESRRELAQVVLLLNWDFAAAERLYRGAIELNSSDTVARQRFAWLLVAERRYDEAVFQIDRIRLLDPLYYVSADVATLLLYAGRVDEAIQEFERVELLTAPSAPVLRTMATAYLAAGREDDAKDTLLSLLDAGGKLEPDRRERLAGGKIDGVYEYILAVRAFRSPIAVAGFEQLLGRTDAAIDSLNRAVRARDPFVVYLDALPEFAALRADPRFQAVLAEIGISDRKQQLNDNLRLSSATLSVLQPAARDDY